MASVKLLASDDGPSGQQIVVLTPQGSLGVQCIDSSSIASASNFAIVRAGAVTAPPVYATIAEVLPLIAAADGAFDLYIDSTAAPVHLVAPDVLNGQHLLRILPARGPAAGTAMTLVVDDGAQIVNPLGFIGQIDVESTTTTIPALAVSDSLGISLTNGARLRLLNGAARAFVDVAAGGTNILAFNVDFASRYETLAPGIPFVNLAVGAAHSVFYARLTPFTQPQNGTVAGPVGSNYVVVYDASVDPLPEQPSFNGTTQTFQIDSGLVAETALDFDTASLVSHGGTFIAALYPIYTGPLPKARLLGREIETVQQLASPLMIASTAQIIDAITLQGLTGIADTFTGGPGFNAPLPAFCQTDVNSPGHVANLILSITNDTFANLTAGHVTSRLVIALNPRAQA